MFRFSPNPNRAHLINWHEWGSEAFEEAQRQDKLVMLYLGAFWCGICQRMDETTLSVDETITLLNGYFIPVRVEDAQRPDLNVRYSQNGWPTIIFMTPQGDYLASTNYMPPSEFCDVLAQLYQTYTDNRQELVKSLAQAKEQSSATEESTGPGTPRPAIVAEIEDTLLGIADPIYGGYGPDHKFLHPEAHEFLLSRYHVTGETAFVDHVALTLDQMARSRTHDEEDGGFHRYSSKRDWTEPHQEKLLADHAELLRTYLHMLVITGEPRYEDMAREMIAFMDNRLSDDDGVAFLGCQDYVRAVTRRVSENEVAPDREPGSTFWVIDDWVYTDANAQAVSSYLNAYRLLGEPRLKVRALSTLEFIWNSCHDADGRLCHYFDGKPNAPGLLIDKVRVASALLDAHAVTGDDTHLERAKALGHRILDEHNNPSGGFYDISQKGPGHLQFQLTLLTENGLTASLMLRLHDVTGDDAFGDGAGSALGAFTGDLSAYGVFASDFGVAVASFMSPPLTVTLEAAAGDVGARLLEQDAMTRLSHYRLNWKYQIRTDDSDAALYLGGSDARVGPVREPAELTSELLAAAYQL